MAGVIGCSRSGLHSFGLRLCAGGTATHIENVRIGLKPTDIGMTKIFTAL